MLVGIIFLSIVVAWLMGSLYIKHSKLVMANQELSKLHNTNQQLEELKNKNTELMINNQVLEGKLENLTNMNLQEKFHVIADNVINQSIEKLTNNNKEAFSNALNPFKENIDFVYKKINDSHKDMLTFMVHANNVSQTADKLANALLSNNKCQGDWGEVQLLNILNHLGLQQDIDYYVQHNYNSLDSDERVINLRPDVIINLPDSSCVVIDAKVNLVHYEKYVNSDSQDAQREYLQQFVKSVKKQIDDLSAKEYNKAVNKAALFVMMFVPIEGAYELLLKNEQNIYDYALKKHILLVSPFNLLYCLKMCEYINKSEKRVQSIEKVLSDIDKTYEKALTFIDGFEKLGNGINKLSDMYNTSAKSLYQGRGNLVSKLEHLQTISRSNKKIPDNITKLLDTSTEHNQFIIDDH